MGVLVELLQKHQPHGAASTNRAVENAKNMEGKERQKRLQLLRSALQEEKAHTEHARRRSGHRLVLWQGHINEVAPARLLAKESYLQLSCRGISVLATSSRHLHNKCM